MHRFATFALAATSLIVSNLALISNVAFSTVALGSSAMAETRLPTIPPDQYTDEQKKAAEEFLAARKTPVFGPFQPMMYSPQVMNLARATGDYLRYNSAIGNTLSELVVLITAREWSQDYEWWLHYPIALKAGVNKDVADAIGDGRRPTGMSADEEIVYDFTSELHRTKHVSDTTYTKAEARFGKKGVVDMAGIAGYYAWLAMELNMARYEPIGDGPRLARFPN
jgi:4-carboxymuconolactone decarboxylase